MPKTIKQLRKGDVIYVEARDKDTDESRGYQRLEIENNYENHIMYKLPNGGIGSSKHRALNDWFEDKPVDGKRDSTYDEVNEAYEVLKKDFEPTWWDKLKKQLKEEIKSLF